MDSTQTLEVSRVTVHGTLSTYIAQYIGKPIGLITSLLLVRLLSQEDFCIVPVSGLLNTASAS